MSPAAPPRTTMWEVRVAPGRLSELLEWVLAQVNESAQVYRSGSGPVPGEPPDPNAAGDAPDERVVVIDPTGRAAATLAGLPSELAARPPHAWDFQAVRNV